MKSIRELRELRGMQQKELAIALKVSQPTVSDWEAGRKTPSGKSLVKIARFFGISVEELTSDMKEETFTPPRPIVTDSDIKFALFGGEKGITDAQYEEVKRFAAYVRDRDK